MKSYFFWPRLYLVIAALAFFSGCLFKPAKISTRHFVLASVATNEVRTASKEYPAVEIETVKMPPYLRRDFMVIRNSPTEIKYLEDAMWAERLDQGFQRTLAADLSALLSSDSVHSSNRRGDRLTVRVFVNAQRFDVDLTGHGTLIAQWRIVFPNGNFPTKSGEAKLVRMGPSPTGRPEVIATRLSELVMDLSRELARAVDDRVKSIRGD